MTLRVFISLLFLLGCTSCKDEATPPPPPLHVSTVQVSVEDVAVTEVWLRLKFTDAAQPRSYALRRDNVLIATGMLAGADTLLADTTTSPRHTYSYTGLRLTGTMPTDSSSALQVTTLDTTSHTFSRVRIDTLGDGDASALYDVAIINDTLVYAVGEIYKRDSLGNWDPLPYNLVRWDGQQWRLRRVTVMFRGNLVTVPLEGIFAHSATDIWLAGSIPIHGDGVNWLGYDIQTLVGSGATVSRMWGTPAEMYFVGRVGNIIHYTAGTWTRLESGTTVSINDIWGAVDAVSGKRTILCAASNVATPGEKRLLRITDQNTIDTVYSSSDRRVQSVWFQNDRRVFICGGGVFQRRPDYIWHEIIGLNIIPSFTERLRGTQFNDWFVVGDFGTVAHWNGTNVQLYPEADAALVYTSVNYHGTLMVAVGYTATRAVALQMHR